MAAPESSSQPATAAGGPKEEGWKTRMAVAWNDWVHQPVVEDVCWCAFWLVQLLFLAPLYAIGLVCLVLRDCLTGAVLPRLEEPKGRTVLVTGCDSGFGRDLALALYERGWEVFAGCLTDAGANDLAERCGGGGMVALQMDVTKEADVERVVAAVQKAAPGGLFALVNNAGVGRGGIVDWTPMSEFRATMEINFFSMVAITKACLPLLKLCKGARIVNVTSFAGLFHGQPVMSAYCASKHAAEAFTTALRLELKGWGIKVVTVNPSFHKTAIALNGAATVQRAFDNLTPEVQAEYGPRYLRACKSISNRATKSSWDPAHVLQALVRAATASNPRTQYVVGGDAKYLLLPLLNLPVPLVEEIVYRTVYARLVPQRVRDQREQERQRAALSQAPVDEKESAAAAAQQQDGEGGVAIAG